jgi:pimeloyl-ACP methyl ester carboxylesterase
MTEPMLSYVTCPDAFGGHRMAYWQWGRADAGHVILCVHGLSRQGRDFDVLAQALCARSPGRVRVVCPDVAGRGQSDWLKTPMDYHVANYAADMLVLIRQLAPAALDWVGTSMGGLIGMVVCGQEDLPLPAPVRRLVLNDVGPVLQWQALQRIGNYLGQSVYFESLEQAADALWTISSTFGPHTRAQWLALTRPMLKPANGGFTLHYDPAIAKPFAAITPDDVARDEARLWQLYEQIKIPTLLLRGAQSDLLSPQTAHAMTQRGARAQLVEFPGVGHAPTLVADEQVQTVVGFLLGEGVA